MRILVTGEKGKVGLAFREYMKEAHPEVRVELMSVRDGGWRGRSFAGFDAVYHCAGAVYGSAEELYAVNGQLTLELAQKAMDDGVPLFIYLSSMAVYGVSPSLGQGGYVDRETSPSPVSDYGCSKLAGEQNAFSLSGDGFAVASVRAPSIFGRDTEGYLDGFLRLMRFGVFPAAFEDCKKSAIYADNLSELVYLIALHRSPGVFCPQNLPRYSVLEFVRTLAGAGGRRVFISKSLGWGLGLLRRDSRISSVFGRLCYAEELSAAFDHRYLVVGTKEALRRAAGEMK